MFKNFFHRFAEEIPLKEGIDKMLKTWLLIGLGFLQILDPQTLQKVLPKSRHQVTELLLPRLFLWAWHPRSEIWVDELVFPFAFSLSNFPSGPFEPFFFRVRKQNQVLLKVICVVGTFFWLAVWCTDSD